MKRHINKVAVIGSGIMGSGIACHFANIGVEVLLLDIVPRELNDQEKAKGLNIELHYLPPYSPNLNPIERLWKVMNEKVRNNRYFATAKAFRQEIQHFVSAILPDIGSDLDSRINDNFQRFYPAS